jgi:hypothetical protein
MLASYRILTESHLILFRPRGTFDEKDLRRVLERLHFEAPGTPRWNRFVDFTAVEEFDLDYQGVMSESAKLAHGGRPQPGEEPIFRVAILCTQPFAFGLARMIASILERNGIETRAFRDLETLSSWMAMPPDALMSEQGH